MTEPSYELRFVTAAPILDLLLRAGLCAPRLWEHAFKTLPPVERDESLDALSQGALVLPQITWEWAATFGEINSLAPGEQHANLGRFYQALFTLTEEFDVQMSIAFAGPQHADLPIMPPFDGQRVNLVNRSDWISLRGFLGPTGSGDAFPISEDEAIDGGAVVPSELPVFTDPAMRVGRHRVGEVWLRLSPQHLKNLREQPEELLQLLEAVAHARVFQIREMLRITQHRLSEQDLGKLQEQLRTVTSWQRVVVGAIDQLKAVPEEKRSKATEGILEIITGHWDRLEELDDPRDTKPISVFISYARESDEHARWVRRLADALERFDVFDVTFDQYDLHGGKDLTHFMDRGLDCERIVVVVTPEYVRKATERLDGVGYESSVISAQLLANQLSDRVVPVIRAGNEVPKFLRSKVYVDFHEDREFSNRTAELRRALLRRGAARRPPKRRSGRGAQ